MSRPWNERAELSVPISTGRDRAAGGHRIPEFSANF
jgi:hypothetical protein